MLVAVSQPHDLDRIADRGKRITQFVAKHRQELVLAAAGFRQIVGVFPQHLLGMFAFRDVVKSGDGPGDYAVFVFQRREGNHHRNARPIGTFDGNLDIADRYAAAQHLDDRAFDVRQKRSVRAIQFERPAIAFALIPTDGFTAP